MIRDGDDYLVSYEGLRYMISPQRPAMPTDDEYRDEECRDDEFGVDCSEEEAEFFAIYVECDGGAGTTAWSWVTDGCETVEESCRLVTDGIAKAIATMNGTIPN